MNARTLAIRTLRYYWRNQLSVLVGVVIGAAVLIGALVVGDSVQYTLRQMALARIGKVHFAIITNDRHFRTQLADELQSELQITIAPVLMRPAVASTVIRDARANNVQVVGVDERFGRLGPGEVSPVMQPQPGQAVINRQLAEQLNVEAGNLLVVRLDKPSTLPRDMPLADDEQTTIALRLQIHAVVSDAQFGRFGLRAVQTPPMNVFVDLEWLQQQLSLPGLCNAMLMGEMSGEPAEAIQRADAAIRERWTIADAELQLLEYEATDTLELRSRRVFIDRSIAGAAGVPTSADPAAPGTTPRGSAEPTAHGILSYFVNALSHGEKATPYSVVAATDLAAQLLGRPPAPDEIVINTWLAEDLNARMGDEIEIAYYTLSAERQLIEERAVFRVAGITPMEGLAADQALLPDFPGISDSEHCRDWSPGMPIDLDRIRQKDEDYWDNHRGTPKAFISLESGRRLWANRFGDLTAVRYDRSRHEADFIAGQIIARLNPGDVGLQWSDIRTPALRASEDGIPFGGLFVSLSFFIVLAAVILTVLLFVFGIEQRREHIGLMLAVGLQARQVRRILLTEGLLIAMLGSVIGAAGGLLYTRFILLALQTVWSGAVAGSRIEWHASYVTIVLGIGINLLICIVAMWWALRHPLRSSARQMLVSPMENQTLHARRSKASVALAVGVICILAAILIAVGGADQTGMQAAGVFFAGGSILLVGGMALSLWWLHKINRGASDVAFSLTQMALRMNARRSGRSLATILLLACGIFLVVAVQSFRQSPLQDPTDHASGTGGFTLFAQSQLPVLYDLNDPRELEKAGLDESDLEGVSVVPLRVKPGDDASCLNLNRAQSPQLIAVNPQNLARRESFTFAGLYKDRAGRNPWEILLQPLEDGSIPAVADYATLTWALQLKLGDTIDYADEQGHTFQVRICGVIEDSILQGNILISEENFVRKYPSTSGDQMFLIDAPWARTEDVSQLLTQSLTDMGLQVTTTQQRLAMFSEVNNTYLAIFQVLGGLGLILGSAGLGIVVMRNVLERRSELASMRAIGFSRGRLWRMLAVEHGMLVLLATLVGVVAAGVAIIPTLRSFDALGWTAAAVVGIVFAGMAFVALAAHVALRGRLLSALHAE